MFAKEIGMLPLKSCIILKLPLQFLNLVFIQPSRNFKQTFMAIRATQTHWLVLQNNQNSIGYTV